MCQIAQLHGMEICKSSLIKEFFWLDMSE